MTPTIPTPSKSNPPSCTKAPKGWYCTRDEGHDGPCAAWYVKTLRDRWWDFRKAFWDLWDEFWWGNVRWWLRRD